MFGDNCFALMRAAVVASSESSPRQEAPKTTPEESVRKLTIVRTCDAGGHEELSMKRKKTYEFTVVLNAPALRVKQCDALYEAGCDDGTIVTRKGVTFIVFDRKADSLEQAIRSATRDIRAAGFDVKRVEMPALV
jgi:hypothetical protein